LGECWATLEAPAKATRSLARFAARSLGNVSDPSSPPTGPPLRRLVLASASKTRLRVLREAGLDPEVVVSGVDEEIEAVDTASAVVALAERKALAVSGGCPDSLVVACDSLLDFEGERLGKPVDGEEALAYCKRLAGGSATLYTGHYVIDTRDGRAVSDVDGAAIRFGAASDAELRAYVDTGEPLAMAGAFSIEGRGAPFVESIDGSPSAVLGISMPLLRRLLARLDVSITDLWKPTASPSADNAAQQMRQAHAPAPSGQVITVFRSRLRQEAEEEYEPMAAHMDELARRMPGFIDIKSFAAEDGERVSIVTFASLESQKAWREQVEHRKAQRLGRERFYSEYRIQVSQQLSERSFQRSGD
jgi:septum formation protein